jgi:hypothetical protein
VASEFGNRRFVRAVTHDRVSFDFPTGETPTRVREGLVYPHRVSGFCETRICAFRSRDTARRDFPIEGRGIIGRVLWVLEGPEKGIEEHFSSSAWGRKGPGDRGRTLGDVCATHCLLSHHHQCPATATQCHLMVHLPILHGEMHHPPHHQSRKHPRDLHPIVLLVPLNILVLSL